MNEPHPALRWALDTLEARGLRQRMLRERRRLALERPEAREEWELAAALEPDVPRATPAEWAGAIADVARLNDVDPTDAAALIALRDELLAPATPERAQEFAGLRAVTDDVIRRACAALRGPDAA